jgi:hypothetical protein
MTTPTAVPGEGSSAWRARRFAHGSGAETRLQLIQRIDDAYGLVRVLVLTRFVVSMTLPAEGWLERLAAIAVAGLTAIIALTSSNVHPGRARRATGAGLVAIIAAPLANAARQPGAGRRRRSAPRIVGGAERLGVCVDACGRTRQLVAAGGTGSGIEQQVG